MKVVEPKAQARELCLRRSQKHLLSWQAIRRQILQWTKRTSRTARLHDHTPFALLRILRGWGRLEMVLEADVCEEYMELGSHLFL